MSITRGVLAQSPQELMLKVLDHNNTMLEKSTNRVRSELNLKKINSSVKNNKIKEVFAIHLLH